MGAIRPHGTIAAPLRPPEEHVSDFIDDPVVNALITLHHGLPRQGPGSDATTRRLLALARPLPERPKVLDLGCGPGRASLLLAAAGAEVTAVDTHQPYLDELREAAARRGLAERSAPRTSPWPNCPTPIAAPT
ncbi:class I SAM-dependent methyltransferase [Nonomuraea diastatica]|uniref:class I SAM-dependent methyltransferase n=1 Tax=Nonomuraea diastatica TaxID=1848329 RepID=UPI00248270B0|nr:class I SAM-dependent methyltransferase [Nonomuraea diastatica]